MAAGPKSLISREAYLAMERESGERHEYVAGNLIAALHRPTSERGNWLFSRDLRLSISAANVYTYADTSIVCEQTQLEGEYRDNLLNPTVLIEVCSPATEAYDRGHKFDIYKRIPSFRENLLIALEAPVVGHCIRQDDCYWPCLTIAGLEARVTLSSLAYSLKLSDIYDGVTFC